MPRRLSVPLLALLLAALVCPAAAAAGTGEGEAPDAMVVFYFTGISCTHCAQIDPVLFGEWRKAFPDLVIVEYEIQAHPENAYVQNVFADRYGTPRGSPLLVVSPYASFLGEAAILGDGYAALRALYDAPELRSPSFTLAHIDMAALYGSPTVWRNDTVLARTETGGDGLLLRRLLAQPDTAAVISRAGCIPVPPAAVPIAGGTVPFDQAAGIGSWIVRWNGTPADCSGIVPSQPDPGLPSPLPAPEVVPLATIVTLAAVDAINPCALAVLVVILTAVVARYPD
ncbi:MAG: hypothetical protein GKC04_09555, partial [Methanomicrobiales archaeon]|nr:hypothetical protein [Methanomicrobiales archaeon]